MQRPVETRRAILVVGHGSRDPEAAKEFDALLELCRSRSDAPVYGAYLEFAQPDIATATAVAYRNGVRELSVVAATLSAGGHFVRDIPGLVAEAVRACPELQWRYAPLLGERPELRELACERVLAVKPDAPFDLVVVARGSREVAACRQIEELASWMGRRVGAARALACYVSVARPTLEEVLDRSVSGKSAPVVVFPWFLFTGVLVKRIAGMVDRVRAEGKEVRLAQYLGPAPRVADAILAAATHAAPAPTSDARP